MQAASDPPGKATWFGIELPFDASAPVLLAIEFAAFFFGALQCFCYSHSSLSFTYHLIVFQVKVKKKFSNIGNWLQQK